MNALKEFFKSLWVDFKNLFVKNYLKLIGFVIMLIVPIVFIVIEYVKVNNTQWTLPAFVWLPLIVFILVWWSKVHGWIGKKIDKMEIENIVEKGKHYAAIIVLSFFDAIMLVAPFLLGYFMCKSLEELVVKMSDLFLFLAICEAVGSFFLILNRIKNTTKGE